MDTMTMPTKAQIDALVEAMPPCNHGSELSVMFGRACTLKSEVASTLYLAAGLNADGSEKAVAVRCWMVSDPRGIPLYIFLAKPKEMPDAIPGVFTPDGAPSSPPCEHKWVEHRELGNGWWACLHCGVRQ